MGLDIYFYKFKNVKKDENTDLNSLYKLDGVKKRAEFFKFMERAVKRLEKAESKGDAEYAKVYNTLFKRHLPKWTSFSFMYDIMGKSVKSVWETKKFLQDFGGGLYRESDAYFRKVNFIYGFFKEKLDEHEKCEVSKDDIETLIDNCDKVLKNHDLAEELLPTRDGFFFGSTAYDEWYFNDVRDCRKQMKKLLKDFDEDNDIIFVQMDW